MEDTTMILDNEIIQPSDEKTICSILDSPDSIVVVRRDLKGGGTNQVGLDASRIESRESQRRIEEDIRQRNINHNMELAYEHLPETFTNVTMLYIHCKINGYAMKAFIDSGAQRTIISKCCAEKCGLMHLIDRRFHGEAHGVGVQRIIGRIHLAQLEIAGSFFASSFCVLEEQRIDILLGLDMLRRHQCSIDLERNRLSFKISKDQYVHAPFLSEREIPHFNSDMFGS